MAVEQIRLITNERAASVNHRVLGTLGMLGSPMLLLEILLVNLLWQDAEAVSRSTGVLEIMYLGGWMCSATGLRRLRATGTGALAQAVFIVQMVGLLLAATFTLQGIIQPHPDANSLLFKLTDAAWPLSHLFMLVVGGFVLYAKVWRGWRKFTPLLCGLALPVFFAVSIGLGREVSGILFGVATACTFMLLGYAVRTAEATASATAAS